MRPAVNDFVVKFANVNGSGSASANNLFARAIFRMGVPVSPRNIFPSNIQGLPTWYEVRVSGKGYLGCRGGVDVMVAMNPQTLTEDIASLSAGGFLLHDSTKPLAEALRRADIHSLGIPLTALCLDAFGDTKERQLLKNIVYVGALAALLDIETAVLEGLLSEQYRGKEKLLEPNRRALAIGHDYARAHFECPLPFRVERMDAVGARIFIDGNSAAALGCVYAGATVAGWYPITPSTSLVDAFERYAKAPHRSGQRQEALRRGASRRHELAAIGMVVGAAWNGARAFTATSGPGISLMTEFLGLAYFAEIPVVLFDIQRAGPSTGMPTRTQQADILACAYASHGDTKHVLLFPADPKECFDLAAIAFDLAERLQTPVIVLSDLEIGMNDWLCEPFSWNDDRRYDRGKVLDGAALDATLDFGRYRDVDGDGIAYRTLPGAHPEKGAFFTRGSSHDRYARYTENSAAYADNMQRLLRKYASAAKLVPGPVVREAGSRYGVIYYGSTSAAMPEVLDRLRDRNIDLDALRIRAFPFSAQVYDFIEGHDTVFLVEQNRDAQLRTLIVNEGNIVPDKLVPVLHYDGSPITASFIIDEISTYFPTALTQPALDEVK
ncbi:MAG: 2-oxoacid:acceptor oxidoreductase subunit alpha [Gammaproteobacteria bacterium]